MTPQQQYAITKQKQDMRLKLRQMLSAAPGSVEHRIKVLAYDKMNFELRAMRNRIELEEHLRQRDK